MVECDAIISSDDDVDLLEFAKCVVLQSTATQNNGNVDTSAEFIAGGITNKLVRVHIKSAGASGETAENPEESPSFVFRLFGRADTIDRQTAVRTFLERNSIGKKIFFKTDTYQVEEWISGRSLDTAELRDKTIWSKVARQIAALHSLPLGTWKYDDGHTTGRTEATDNTTGSTDKCDAATQSSCIWDSIENSLTKAEGAAPHDAFPNIGRQLPTYCEDDFSFRRIRQDVKHLQQRAEMLNVPVVFSHNDLLSGNILQTPTGEIRFIDFEYGGPAERTFDIANHFCEWAGFECEWQHCPSEEIQRNFIAEYLNALLLEKRPEGESVERCVGAVDMTNRGEHQGKSSEYRRQRQQRDCRSVVEMLSSGIVDETSLSSPVDKTCCLEEKLEVDRILKEVRLFYEASHYFWGSWALEQACTSHVDFDFAGYAARRLKAARKCREN